MLEFYAQFIKKGDLCFDVGANIGNRTEVFLALGATVVAVEPQGICAGELMEKYSRNKDFILVQKALGSSVGQGKMWLNSTNTISSLSQEWMAKVSATNRFYGTNYYEDCMVEVTTLDELVEMFGKPQFCKIDVEGFEFQVLQGLSQPLQSISFEYTCEDRVASERCINYLDNLGKYEFNFSFGESMQLDLENWVNAKAMVSYLRKFTGLAWGDVYARLPQ